MKKNNNFKKYNFKLKLISLLLFLSEIIIGLSWLYYGFEFIYNLALFDYDNILYILMMGIVFIIVGTFFVIYRSISKDIRKTIKKTMIKKRRIIIMYILIGKNLYNNEIKVFGIFNYEHIQKAKQAVKDNSPNYSLKIYETNINEFLKNDIERFDSINKSYNDYLNNKTELELKLFNKENL